MKKNNQKGFTLIEIVVTVAIIAIFSGIITMLISNGSASYRSTSGNAKVQMEVQETLNQIQDLVIDTNRTMYYGPGEVNDITLMPNDIDGGGLDDKTIKTLVVCSASEAASGQKDKEDYVWDVLTWKGADKKIYYNRYEKKDQLKYEEPLNNQKPDGTGSSTETTPTAGVAASAVSGVQNAVVTPDSTISMEGATSVMEESSVFAEDIVGFWADIHEVETKGVVRFQIQADKRGKNIKTLHTVNLRNKVKIEKPGNISALPSVEASIKITNIPAELADDCGGYLFEKVTFGEVMANSINWSVTGENGTVISGWEFPDTTYGKLMIKTPYSYAGEYITVTVKATSASGKEISDSCKVKIVRKVKPIFTADSIIVGVGNSYDLNEFVKVNAKYPDGTEVTFDKTNATFEWNAIGTIKIGKNGIITIPADFSESQYMTSVTMHTSAGGTIIDGSIEVLLKIAKIELLKPSGVYHVGDKKILSYVCKVGGVEETSMKPIVEVKNKDTSAAKQNMNYSSQEDVFIADEIGHWTATVFADIGNGKKITHSSDFEVVPNKIEFVYKNPIDGKCNVTVDQTVWLETILRINGVEQKDAKIDWICTDQNGKDCTNVCQGTGTKIAFQPPASGIYTITATYVDEENKNHVLTFTITVDSLFMTIVASQNDYWKGQKGELIATIRNSDHEQSQDVTSSYNIDWFIDQQDTAYDINPKENSSETMFEVAGDIKEVKKVIITAKAYKKDDVNKEKSICECSYVIMVHHKKVYAKKYDLVDGVEQVLEHNIENEHLKETPVTVLSYNPSENEIKQLLMISKPTNKDWSVLLINPEKWDAYDSITLGVEYNTCIYSYTLCCKKNNVYNYNKIKKRYELIDGLYIPGDSKVIRENSDISKDGYTCMYNKTYELKYSINRFTGWLISGFWNSSAGKWFMKYNNRFYRYDSVKKAWFDWSGINTHITEDILKHQWNGKSLLISYPPEYYWQKWN